MTPKESIEQIPAEISKHLHAGPDGPRELTEDEVQRVFLDHVRAMCRYWVQESRATTVKEKVEGVAFSILVALDGGNIGLPGFIVVPSPHPDDKEYRRSRGENWYPENDPGAVKCDIGGSLHEHFHIHEEPSSNAASDTIPAGSPWENT